MEKDLKGRNERRQVKGAKMAKTTREKEDADFGGMGDGDGDGDAKG